MQEIRSTHILCFQCIDFSRLTLVVFKKKKFILKITLPSKWLVIVMELLATTVFHLRLAGERVLIRDARYEKFEPIPITDN